MSAVKADQSARTPVKDAIKLYLRYGRQRFTERTINHYEMVIWRFVKYMPQFYEYLTPEHIERYLMTVGNCNATRNRHLTPIKSFCRFMSNYRGLDNPAGKVKMLIEDPPKARCLTEDEYKKVLAVCKPAEADIIKFLAHTGLRKTELQKLTWQNISQDRQYIRFTGKHRKLRSVPLNETCRAILSKYPQQPNSISIDLTKNYQSRDALYRMCKRLAKRAGISKFGPHSLRHYFACILYNKGVPVQFISAILGHADTKTTEAIYCKLWQPKSLLGVTDILD